MRLIKKIRTIVYLVWQSSDNTYQEHTIAVLNNARIVRCLLVEEVKLYRVEYGDNFNLHVACKDIIEATNELLLHGEQEVTLC